MSTDAKSEGDTTDADVKMRMPARTPRASNAAHKLAVQSMEVGDMQKKEAKLPKRFRVMFGLNGLAYLMHHCGSCIVHTSICAHHVELEVVTMTLISNAMQHAICYIQFSHPNVSAGSLFAFTFAFFVFLSLFPFSWFPVVPLTVTVLKPILCTGFIYIIIISGLRCAGHGA